MRNRWTVALAVAGLALGACDDGDGGGTPLGEYRVTVIETRDTCDGVPNDLGTTMVLEQVDGQLRLEFGGFPAIPASLNPDGTLGAQGVVDDRGEDGTTSLRLFEVVFFRGGSVEGRGELTFDRTHPDPEAPAQCVQEFNFTGEKPGTSLAPPLPTAPAPR